MRKFERDLPPKRDGAEVVAGAAPNVLVFPNPKVVFWPNPAN